MEPYNGTTRSWEVTQLCDCGDMQMFHICSGIINKEEDEVVHISTLKTYESISFLKWK